jgi:hypothetical protein
MESVNRRDAQIIHKMIGFLKGNKISQQEIESRLNYTSLSKAKNYDKYPQMIIEKKTRAELIQELSNEFSLIYREADDSVEFIDGQEGQLSLIDTEYYVMHYYAFAREISDRALVKIVNKRKVTIDNYIDEEHWEGLFSVIENYTFIELTKMGYTTPVKKLMCLFSGTMKYGRPILLGTYSTVKRDGYPAAGKVVLEKASSEEDAMNMINQESDFRIRGFLRNNVHVTRTFTPNKIDDLSFNHMDEYMQAVGEYRFFYPVPQDQWKWTDLIIRPDYSADVVLKDVLYKGSISLFNAETLSIRFRRKKVIPSEPTSHLLKVEINIRTRIKDKIMVCAGSSPSLHLYPSAFSCYLAPKDISLKEIHEYLQYDLFLAKTEES